MKIVDLRKTFQLHVMDSCVTRRFLVEFFSKLSTPCNGFSGSSLASKTSTFTFQLHVMDSMLKRFLEGEELPKTFNSM